MDKLFSITIKDMGNIYSTIKWSYGCVWKWGVSMSFEVGDSGDMNIHRRILKFYWDKSKWFAEVNGISTGSIFNPKPSILILSYYSCQNSPETYDFPNMHPITGILLPITRSKHLCDVLSGSKLSLSLKLSQSWITVCLPRHLARRTIPHPHL